MKNCAILNYKIIRKSGKQTERNSMIPFLPLLDIARIKKRAWGVPGDSVTVILLALILGPMCEKNFVRHINIQRGNFFAITTSPIAMIFAAVSVIVIIYSLYNQHKIYKRTAKETT